METRKILVTVDKSHLVTIGEKLYTEKMSFLRELVNNAYDADATEVKVEITPTFVKISDDGSGMDEDGLQKYFTIGASEKRGAGISPHFSRKRIGEFGIGKFAALAASQSFEIETERGDFHARLVFDKESWSRHEDWHLNINILPVNQKRGSGTTIILKNLKIAFMPGKVRRYLAEHSPIHAPSFKVFINEETVNDEVMTGRKIEVNVETQFGPITGLIVIVPEHKRVEKLGMPVCVKGVMVKYETFGLDTSRKLGVARITGRVNADFLEVTSSRDDFLRDTPEFIAFTDAMVRQIKNALNQIRAEGDKKADLQSSRVLKDALTKIGKAMKRHQELFPTVPVPIGIKNAEITKGEIGYEISQAEFVNTGDKMDSTLAGRLTGAKNQKKNRGRPSGIIGTRSVIRKLKIADLDIALRMEHLGDREEESVVSGGVIYINLDHPLYRTYRDKDEILTLHVSRVITKELALRTGAVNAEDAFAIQSELLTDALKGKGV